MTPATRYPFRQRWGGQPWIVLLLLPIGIGLAWAVSDAPALPRYLTWFAALIILMAGLGASMSTTLEVDGAQLLTMRQYLLGMPLSTMAFEPELIRLQQVELRIAFASTTGGGNEGSGSSSKSLRIYLELRSDQGLTLVTAGSLGLPANWSPPDHAREVLGWFQRRGKRDFLLKSKQLADALGLPLVCTGDWGTDSGKALVDSGEKRELVAIEIAPPASAPAPAAEMDTRQRGLSP